MAAIETTYRAHLQTLGVDETALRPDHKGTIAPPPEADSGQTAQVLPRLAILGESPLAAGTAADLKVEDTIGKGGMGIVLSATQLPLRRKVAVKRIHPGRDSVNTRDLLLREALVMGTLEHPNVVPVHALGQDESGAPLLVMKLIEGTPWRDVFRPLFGKRSGRTTEVESDAFEEQLGILMQVCRAIEFAHARGIVHRDLKPENVMIGSFGEVYVVDWGIAASIDPDAALPQAKDTQGIVGTPGYMAPEMAAGTHDEVGRHTDVYLLGAVLHELVTGRKRHEADNYFTALALAWRSEPVEYDVAVPRELAEICNRASAADPAKRYSDVAAFRNALADFLRHRTARELAAGAEARLRKIDAIVQGPIGSSSISDAATVHALAAEARFGFEQALEQAPDHAEARAGLRHLLETMIDFELQHENRYAAAALLAQLDESRPDIQHRIDELTRALGHRRQELVELERIRHDADLAVVAPQRRRIALLNGLVLAVSIGGLFISRKLGLHKPGYLDAVVVMGVFTLVAGVSRARLAKEEVNRVNRRLFAGIAVGAWSVFAHTLLVWWLGVPFVAALASAMLIAAAVTAALTVLVDKRLAWTAIAFVATAVGVGLFPDLRGLIMAVGCMIAFGLSFIAWRDSADISDQADVEITPRAPEVLPIYMTGMQRPIRPSPPAEREP